MRLRGNFFLAYKPGVKYALFLSLFISLVIFQMEQTGHTYILCYVEDFLSFNKSLTHSALFEYILLLSLFQVHAYVPLIRSEIQQALLNFGNMYLIFNCKMTAINRKGFRFLIFYFERKMLNRTFLWFVFQMADQRHFFNHTWSELEKDHLLQKVRQ